MDEGEGSQPMNRGLGVSRRQTEAARVRVGAHGEEDGETACAHQRPDAKERSSGGRLGVVVSVLAIGLVS